ncbi:XTP/dITP diphosphatase [Brochothrix campestris]|uniref:dITP/XTP pyrophosphatase n=1 Tax=Brochothrix campestris FSL F6-1037 TaxID=1265861 RepID=W7D5V9_9LIST|nr:XTP/dITP diphosphatase [Brochothrix campestris]EUJ40673.1 nucleoside-triphosphatase [Brochothrix campestris FSL F6-1037]
MKKLLIATHNEGKAFEFKALFEDYGITIETLNDYPEIPEIEETGKTFKENAALKAEAIANLTNQMVISDDSGLSVDALDGAPGVYSARYAGEPKSDANNNAKLIAELAKTGTTNRTAKFHCTIAVAVPDEATRFYEGEIAGVITKKAIGTAGFGYDPYFYVPSIGKTTAQMTMSEKNLISHRGNAIKQLALDLPNLIALVSK